MITAHDFVAEARKLIGVKWRHEGRTRLGIDCVGLIYLAASNAGLDLNSVGVIDERHYSRKSDPRLLELVERYCVRTATPVAGCVVFFKFYHEKHPRHFGICTEKQTVIHADAKRGLVLEHGHRAHWANWTHSLWLLPGVSYE